MPTGYTAEVASGKITTLPEFLKPLARGMGFLILMRDEPADAPIPEKFEPSNWHAERLAEAKTKISELTHMQPDEIEEAARKTFEEDHAGWKKWRAERGAQAVRYNQLIAELEAWEPTHEAMIGLKKLGLEQLRGSLRFDCGTPESTAKFYPEPTLLTPDAWMAAQMKDASWKLDYHTKEHADEVRRTNERNECLRVFREELAALEAKQPSPAA